MKTTVIVSAILVGAGIGTARVGAQPVLEAPAAAITARAMAGRGGWKTDTKEARITQRWNLDVTRGDDNAIRGRITVADSPLFHDGAVSGHLIGSTISGAITGEDGRQVASFTGTVTKKGMHGKYTDRSGETGEWAWDGAPPP